MRTLKKALSLVLVLAMVFTLAVPALAVDKASEFKDYDKVQNKEAVDVLTALDVISGNPDGTFGAEGKFTRAQAATMITYLTLGKTIADALPTGGNQFTDVPAKHWASKYIQYCANEGIINGYGDGKFGPDDELTATQWSLMLLGALGYNAKNEGIGGTGWEITATKLAMKAGVASAEDLTAAFNRDMAAKMAFNTLTANVVEYEDNGTNITVGDTVINVGAKKAKTVDAVKDSNGNVVDYNDSNDGKAQFCEVHFPTLKKVTSGTNANKDHYGRPGATWQYGKTNAQIGVYSTATPVATYTTAVSANELYKVLGSKAVLKASGSNVTVRGANEGKIFAEGKLVDTDIVVSNKATAIGGAGVITEIYTTDTANEYIVVQIRPELLKVTNVKNVKATATTGAYTQYTVGGKTYEVYTSEVSGDEVDTAVINGTVAKDDYVMVYGYTYDSDDYAVISAATLVTGKLTGYTSSTNSYTIDGESYPLSDAYGAEAPTGYNQTATYAIDTYGNVVAPVTVTTASNYAFVVESKLVQYYDTDTMVMTPGVQATIVTVDGELKTVKTSNKDAKELTAGGIYTYTVNTKGVYTLKGGTTSAGTGIIVDAIDKKPEVATGKYANANTKYYVVQKTTDDEGNVTYTGVSAYTGYANAPSLNLKGVQARAVDANKDNIVEVVFVMPASETVSDNLVYVTGSFTSDGTKITYDVIVKGEPTKMVLNGVVTRGLYNVTNGNATSANTAPLYMTYNEGLFMTCTTEDGTYAVDSTYKTVGADVPVYTFENGACEVTTAADLSATGSTNVALATATVDGRTTITAIYIVK